ncbi:aminopeptidase [Opitutus sp. ER46]|uniref:aminopeptidase n=1 Tax=Opitutus sp. ER46 TaxID=2161864 RepID=UPI000D32323F|nr:aminopeptidase [Opitutus sp. ER46]PTX98908.1 aminopeptidase [Opitutus sp. ER46]
MIIDPRYNELADGLIGFSTQLKKGERVLIDAFDVPDEMVIALVRAARARGAYPYVQINRARITRELHRGAEEAQFAPQAEVELARMQKMDAYVALRGSNNIFETSDVPSERVQLVSRLMKPVLDYRVGRTKWVVLRWPSAAMAQQAGMSTEAFEDFYFKVCTLDYSRLTPGMKALADLMERTDRVQIKGPGTDLSFSIKGIGARACGGRHNIPDGEVFSCPVRDSVEGHVQYNAPTVYLGTSFDNIRLAFRKGKVVEATGSNTARLNEILDSDAGARYIGEFALGFNPHILQPMRDILFDEKIAGSFHFTPGQAYEGVGNGNKSQVHWDMVCIQRPEYGGGEIWFDGKLIRKDGLFVPKSLHKLNPAYLLGSSR